VVGVAVGFGAQTVVKDVISGMFYVLDDAFRVGEYIQSGNYKGTVESFSLRSVKLRHQNGPIYTVPFGELGAVQNMSRDWVIELSRRDLRHRSREGQETDQANRQSWNRCRVQAAFSDFEDAGVQEFGDYAIQRLKMTQPGRRLRSAAGPSP
jgi:hypothetical protein